MADSLPIHFQNKCIFITPLKHLHQPISGTCTGCNPVKESTTNVFHVTVQHTVDAPMETLVLRDKSPVSMCKPNLACYEYLETWTKTSVRYLGGRIYEFNITIKNVTKLDEGKWTLKYLGTASLKSEEPLFVCQLRVFDVSLLNLDNCPDTVEETQEAHCLCRVQNDTNFQMTFGWYDNNGRVLNNSDPFLTFKASRGNAGYECRGKTESGLVNKPLKYEPSVVAKSRFELIDCTVNTNEIQINVTCHIQRIYPEAICDFDFIFPAYHTKSQPYNELTVYKNKPWPEDNLYYSSECEIVMPIKYDIDIIVFSVTVYPNVTGSKRDEVYGATKIFHFRISQDNKAHEEVSKPNLEGYILISVLIIGFILSIIILNVIYKHILMCYKYPIWCIKIQFGEEEKSIKQSLFYSNISFESDLDKSSNVQTLINHPTFRP